MIPYKNKEKFIELYGNWWYLRDFDFLVENLADSQYDMTAERMRIVRSKERWAVYDDYDKAVSASMSVRRALGLPPVLYPSREDVTYDFHETEQTSEAGSITLDLGAIRSVDAIDPDFVVISRKINEIPYKITVKRNERNGKYDSDDFSKFISIERDDTDKSKKDN